jgi:hypothetical protein
MMKIQAVEYHMYFWQHRLKAGALPGSATAFVICYGAVCDGTATSALGCCFHILHATSDIP